MRARVTAVTVIRVAAPEHPSPYVLLLVERNGERALVRHANDPEQAPAVGDVVEVAAWPAAR